eukprot:scaffold193801_cov28-Prasinocladus_malaysianus.AAC.1
MGTVLLLNVGVKKTLSGVIVGVIASRQMSGSSLAVATIVPSRPSVLCRRVIRADWQSQRTAFVSFAGE